MLGRQQSLRQALFRTRLRSACSSVWRREVFFSRLVFFRFLPAGLQVYSNAAGWQTVAGCSVTPMLTADADVSKRDSHAWLFGWKGATVFQVH